MADTVQPLSSELEEEIRLDVERMADAFASMCDRMVQHFGLLCHNIEVAAARAMAQATS